MPVNIVKTMAKKHDMTEAKVEKVWEKAKKQAEKEGHPLNYGYITTIFKSMMGEKVKERDAKEKEKQKEATKK